MSDRDLAKCKLYPCVDVADTGGAAYGFIVNGDQARIGATDDGDVALIGPSGNDDNILWLTRENALTLLQQLADALGVDPAEQPRVTPMGPLTPMPGAVAPNPYTPWGGWNATGTTHRWYPGQVRCNDTQGGGEYHCEAGDDGRGGV